MESGQTPDILHSACPASGPPVSQPRWDGLRLGTGLQMGLGEPGASAAAERGTPAPPCAQSSLSLVTYTEPLRQGAAGWEGGRGTGLPRVWNVALGGELTLSLPPLPGLGAVP